MKGKDRSGVECNGGERERNGRERNGMGRMKEVAACLVDKVM